jgi:Spy/CpxP family protein refolding chaperone
MNTIAKRRWMLGTMFIVGLVTGAVGAAGLILHFLLPMPLPSGEEMMRHASEDLRSELNITPEQEREIRPALGRHGAELDTIRRETLMKVLASIQAKNIAVEQILTPDQRSKFEVNEAQRLKKFSEKEKISIPPSP